MSWFDCSIDSKLSSIEMFSAANNTWSYVTDMPGSARLGVAAAVVGDALILVGGYGKGGGQDGGDISGDVHRFNILTNRSCTACTAWAKKTAHCFLCNNFAYSRSFFILFGTLYTVGNLQLGDA